ncbi:putative phage abortive infection protein [Yersinia intermedia]|uniref:putative phage abortive infection protein n=1 Tax=Yersinia intermedia TaxID=631 RepID=UPI002240642C|nr:putative phage abortive infection protein [Yersinia intermedia]UZM72791.1 putative phage abortive infection protein [Yersinia intermedia]
MILLFVVVFILIGVFWSWFQTNAAIIGGLATALAFFATAWAAHEGRKSAKAALRAVKTSENALEETRANYRMDAFNQRFSLLLAQHNTYLEKVNTYVRTDSGWSFIKKLFDSKKHYEAFDAMSGHITLSPYMRILYHTLKFIEEDFFGSKDDIVGRKKYTSLIRSLISNDVLFLIAVNSIYIRNEGACNQYYKYQYLLQRFDFFEHADFFIIYHQNDIDKKNELKEPFRGLEYSLRLCFHEYVSNGNYNSIIEYKPEVRVPVIVAYIYKNPLQNLVINWFNNVPRSLVKIFIEKIDKRDYSDIFNEFFSDHYLNCYVISYEPNMKSQFNVKGKLTLDSAIIKSIVRAVKDGRLKVTDCDNLRLVVLKKGTCYVSFYNEFKMLYNRIQDYSNAINRKNEILFGKGFYPVQQMAGKISEIEKKLRRQRAQ